MRVIVCNNYEEMSSKAANIVACQLTLKPNSILGLATGSTPIGMYKKLAEMNKNGDIDFSEVSTFNLDEYYPIAKSNKQSYNHFMNENLFNNINIDKANTHLPNGEAADAEAECKKYEEQINQSAGIDLQILGIGINGHIGFNEPDMNLNCVTHLTKLTQNTIDANSRFFSQDEKVPTAALTMGISTILKSKKIVLLASGSNKSRVVSELLNDDINTSIPATLLKTHSDVILVCDKDAYAGMRLGIDIGGTATKFVVLEKNQIKYKSKIAPPTDNSKKFIECIAAECSKIITKYPVKTIGIGTPGYIKNGLVTAANLPFKETPIVKEMKKYTDLPITLENDANCAALAESKLGNAKKYDNIITVTIGTGIGGGIILDKQMYRGKNSMGEIGHIIVDANGLKCPCGQNGCWEQYASVTALVREAVKAAKSNIDSLLYKTYKENNDKIDGKLFFEVLNKNCSIAADVYKNYIEWISVGLKSLINIFGPNAIILAGGITENNEKLANDLQAKVNSCVKIEVSALQNDAGAIGAALL